MFRSIDKFIAREKFNLGNVESKRLFIWYISRSRLHFSDTILRAFSREEKPFYLCELFVVFVVDLKI